MTEAGHVDAEKRLISISFDSMKQRRGIAYDNSNEFSGVDVHTRFDVVTRQFRAMAEKEVSRHAYQHFRHNILF